MPDTVKDVPAKGSMCDLDGGKIDILGWRTETLMGRAAAAVHELPIFSSFQSNLVARGARRMVEERGDAVVVAVELGSVHHLGRSLAGAQLRYVVVVIVSHISSLSLAPGHMPR
jgi:hypothetical protein